MKSIIITTALAVGVSVVTATPGIHSLEYRASAPVLEARQYNASTYEGCFSSAGSLTKKISWQYNTNGWCQEQCVQAGFTVEGLTNGKDCYCGNELPPSGDKVDDGQCSTVCPGWGEVHCGANNFFSVYLTGLNDDAVSSASASSSPSVSASSTSSATPSVVTVGGQTMTVTAGATSSPASKSSGSSKVGIAVGVVVGLLVASAAAGGAYFFWRRKQKRELHEEHQKASAISSFIGNGRSPAMSGTGYSDSHLDQSVMASNRLSNGSLADNADYSRRILKVTNA